MKPSPHLIERAAQALGVEPDACTLIGDLTAAGADAVIARIDELTEAIRAS